MEAFEAAGLRLPEARDMPSLLGAAYEVFQYLLAACRRAEQTAGSLLPAFVMAAAAAGDGRDAVLWAPSLPASVVPVLAASPGDTVPAAAEAARLGHLSLALAARLTSAAGIVAGGDGDALAESALCAARIGSLLAGPGRDARDVR